MKNSAKHIADRIRLMLATKQFQVGEVLPSTRELGKQLEASFHTVRKAYHILEDEGLITGVQGRGFVVNRQTPMIDKSQRLEVGAEKIQMLVEELVGYGLDDEELETLFSEQLDFMEWPSRIESCATVGETREIAHMMSESIASQVGVKSKVLTADQYSEAANFDALFVPIQLLNAFRSLSESLLIIPIIYTYKPEVLLNITDRSVIETIGLVCSEEKTIPRIISDLKHIINFEGAFIAGTTQGRSLPNFVRTTDLILYTPESAKLVEPKIPVKNRLKLEYVLSDKSAEMIRAELWDQ
jgi:DNA-binding transcriptional regulator YhcF (GntR family)